MNSQKIFHIGKIVNCVLHKPPQVLRRICLGHSNKSFYTLNVRNMSQKSITSFFKITPKKGANGIENDQTNRSSKRLRSESIENVSPKTSSKSPSPVSPEKKKKVKRQRIESSESETDCAKEEKGSISVKVENQPKTYESPKNKRNKSKARILDVKSPVGDESPKQNKSYAVNESPKDNESPNQKMMDSPEEKPKIKTENITPSPKMKKVIITKEQKGKIKDDEKIMSAFLTKETVCKKDSGIVKEENKRNVKKPVKADIKSEDSMVPEAEYNPEKSKYHPVNDACWTKGQKVPYLALARTLEVIESTSARLKMVEILSNYFRSVITLTPEDLLPSIYLCLNQLAPAYEGLELGIAETYLMKAIGQCTGRTLAQVKNAAQRCGDLGAAAQQARSTQRTMFTPAPLSVARVLAALREVAAMTGQASVNKKIGKIQSLYVACRHSEAKYLIRSLEGKLRVGLAEQSLLQALALATAATPPAGPRVGCLDVAKELPSEQFKSTVDEYALIIKTTYCECPNYELVVPVLLQYGVHALPQHCRLAAGIPLKPMLAHPTRGVHEIFSRFEGQRFTCEWKYDGERAQLHVPGDSAPQLLDARIFSRNQEENTSKYPDVLARLPALLKPSVTSCVLDCEAVAYDTVNKQIMPFQVLATRKRKDADAGQIKVQVCVFLFDLLLLNGRALVREPLAERRALLREHFNECPGEWQFAESRDCSSMEEVQQFLEEAVRGSCEGLMVKMLHGDGAKYDIARRSHNWLKLKKDYLEGVGDSIDAVVIGAYRGRGRRGGRYGGFLLACFDAPSERYQTLCKLGTGFTDRDLDELAAQLDRHLIDEPRNYYSYEASLAPDVWFAAACVWELRCADLSLSPAHRAAHGRVHRDKGISLRFPRFVRVREDKAPEQTTSSEQLAAMYLAQDQVRNQAQPARRDHHDDFY